MWVLLNQLDQELKAVHPAVAAFRRVIFYSQIHSETNRATQQVSHSLLVTTPCNPDLSIFSQGAGESCCAWVWCVSQLYYSLLVEPLCWCVSQTHFLSK